ncbi:MAG: hypothetical protein FJ014_11635 [Chloroflexi bacterium]|nr:hypothetical protein [Chloroflexota bacterium]
MYQKTVFTSESPCVEVTACQGDLAVATWDKAEVLIEVDSEEVLTVEEREGVVALAANSDCSLTVPAGASLVVVQARGDLSVRGVHGTVKATTVRGDAQVRQVNGPVELGTVGGDLLAEELNGPLSVRSVAGDAYLRQLNGMLYLSDVGADLAGGSWTAGADVAQVGGDVSLKTVFVKPFTYEVRAQGNLVVKALSGSNATFTLQAAKGQIMAKGLTGEMTEGGQWQAVIGDGEAQVTLISTHGNVLLKAGSERGEDEERDAFASLGADFGKIGAEAGMAAQELAWRIQQRVAEKLAKIDFEAIARREAERARRYAERETARAQRMAEKAQRKAERAQQKAQKKVMWHLEWDTGRGRPRAAGRSQVASEEERLAVLRMLAEGKISAQEAETLLQALEG